jgi:hypothetical protein
MPVPIDTVPTLSLSTPLKQSTYVLNKTPDTILLSSSEVSSSSSYSFSDSSTSCDDVEVVAEKASNISDHKREQLEGKHLPEPLLEDNAGRFVLFPIQHKDVSCLFSDFPLFFHRTSRRMTVFPHFQTGLGYVQEGRGLFLDSGGDRFGHRSKGLGKPQ